MIVPIKSFLWTELEFTAVCHDEQWVERATFSVDFREAAQPQGLQQLTLGQWGVSSGLPAQSCPSR